MRKDIRLKIKLRPLVQYPLSEDLVDGRALLHFAHGDHFGPLLPHVQHKGVQRLLDVQLFVLVALALCFRRHLPVGTQA